MQNIVREYLEQTRIGRKQSFQNLTMYPLVAACTANVGYILLDEAMAGGLIEVVEVDEAGAVSRLKVVNKSPDMVLILDGEELVGAKQNRIVNTTILIQAKSTTLIPVSCVEQGRWSYDSPRFHSEKRLATSRLRAMKAEQVHLSVQASGDFRSDQGAIWDEISEKASRMDAVSPSMAMSRIYERGASSLDEYVNHFKPADKQVGAVFVINGKVAGLDSFGTAKTFSAVFRKLVQSYALDAIDWFDPGEKFKSLKGDVTRFLKDAARADVESRPSVGAGTDWRLASADVTGFALALDAEVLHLSVFARRDGHGEGGQGSSIQRFSTRQRTRS